MIKFSQTAPLHEVLNSANWCTRHVQFKDKAEKCAHAIWLEMHMMEDVMILNWRQWTPPQLEIRFSSQADATFWDLSQIML
jgi:hypothetical protein